MVEAIRGYGVAGRTAVRARAGGAGFRLPGAEAQASEATGSVSALTGTGLLGLQDQASDAERDAAARRRGGALLDALAELQKAMLSGQVSRATLGRLAALAEGESGADPGLRDLLGQVSLRVRVELLRLRD
jgi:hypothetical protein